MLTVVLCRISCLEWLLVSASTWYMWTKEGKACLIVIASPSDTLNIHGPSILCEATPIDPLKTLDGRTLGTQVVL